MSSTSVDLPASCADDYDPTSLAPAEAIARITAALTSVTARERVAIRASLDRILAEDVHSRINVPLHTNSAMDGYALRSQDLAAEGSARLRLVGTAFAGAPYGQPVQPGECVRIMTGGVMPDGADAVVIQEQAVQDGDGVVFPGGVKSGDNVRAAGEDIREGQIVLQSGTRIRPAELGLLASLGIPEVTVRRRLRVAFFSTGDELRSLGETLKTGEVYDSNRYTLFGMLARLGADIIDMGVVRDEPDVVRAAFTEAASNADVVISSGGVSVGEADYIRETLQNVGQIEFWKVAMKPGRPLAFGRIKDAVFFGLPGNPVSVMVTFYEFVQPALRRLMGETATEPLSVTAVCRSRLKKRPGRIEYQRGILRRGEDGRLEVHKTGAQGSGILSSMSEANCLIVLQMDQATVEPGDLVDVQPFHGLI